MLSLYLVTPDHPISQGGTLTIAGDEAHHIARVARHQVGEEILISDGAGVRARSEITRIDRDSVEVKIIEKSASERPRVLLHVVQALPKSDRAHECVELLVAAGVDEITPWGSERSIAKWDAQASPEKWRSWIRAAVKQTRRDRIPLLHPMINKPDLTSSRQELLLAFHEDATDVLSHEFFERTGATLSDIERITIVIGPEGGVSPRELEQLSSREARIVRLGTPILRSAHAGAIALAAIQSTLSIWR